jgi:hypothetical protein
MLNIPDKNTHTSTNSYGFKDSIFILCENCYCCATYFDKARFPTDKCPECSSTELTSFPIMSDDAFTFSYSKKHGIELEFKRRS